MYHEKISSHITARFLHKFNLSILSLENVTNYRRSCGNYFFMLDYFR